MKKAVKKLLTFVMAAAMLIGSVPMSAFAADTNDSSGSNADAASTGTEIETGKTYSVPLIFYGPLGKLLTEEPYSGTVQDYMDNVALVKKNDNGTYHVTLQIENYEKIDILQFSKPGVISDDIAPSNAPMGTFNIPEKYIANNEENPSEATEYLKEQGQINEEWNDKYIQNYSVEKATTGVSWYSFDVDTLEGTMYTKAFYSYGRTDDDLESYMYGIVNGKFTFDVNNAVVAKEINEENYKNIGLELSKVVTSVGDSPDFTGFVAEEKTANDLFSGTCEAKIENGKVTVTAETSSIDSIRVLEEIKDLGECTYPSTSSYRQYMYAYSREVKKNKYISVYSDNILEDGKFSIEYENLEEAIFGKQVEIQTEDGTYYGELRVRTTPKEKLELTDGDVTLVTDNYTVNSKAKFGAELLQETSDEDSEYNKYYSLLAGNASKALIYNLSLKMNDSQVIPSRAVELRVKIPKDWDTSKIEVQWYYPVNEMFNPIEYFDSSSYKNDDGSIHMEGDELVITGTTRVYNTIAITQKADKVDISEIQDGTYNVNVTMWQQDQPDRLSMSNAAVVNDSARLEVKNGKKHIYFDTQGIVITGRYGYTNGIFWANNEQTEADGLPVLSEYTPLDYYSYYLNDAGNTDMDSYAEEYDLYYPKTVGFEFPESADRDDGVYLNFYVPIMDELQHAVPGSGGGCRTAFMTLSGLTPVAEINEPIHDKSVLVVAVDKASKYSSDDYTDDSYKALSDAVAKAQNVINGTTTANDSEIVALDKEISDAIASLKELTGLEKYNRVLAAANALSETDYTAESWSDLQAVITAQTGSVTEENADQASAELKAAVDALVPMSTAVSLESGVYEVQASFTNADGSANDLSTALKSARLSVDKDGNVTAYLYTDSISGMQYRKGAGYSDAVAETGRLAVSLPANVENHKVKVTTESGETELLLHLDLKAAVKQEISKADLTKKLADAKAYAVENYTEDSYAVLTAAITAAEVVQADAAAFQNEIDAAASGLDSAAAGLVMKEEVKARLTLDQALADAKNNYAAANYTKESYENLQTAISEAEKVLDNTASTAEELNAQKEKLQNAVNALVRLEDAVDKTELNGYIADALTKVNENNTYTENSWNSFQSALKAAQKVAENVNATSEEVEKVTDLLTSSYEALTVSQRQGTLFPEYPQIFAGTYTVPIRLVNATSDEDSMGNASVVQTGIVRVSEKGDVTLELNFQSMQFAGMTGYLYKLKKVDMDTVEYNKYNYPIKYEAEDATVLEEYKDVYDLFNDKTSKFYDKNTGGNWYPKTVSMPIKLNDNLFYVEVYVPVMESIGEGQGTKVARVAIDWANIEQKSGVARDNSVLEALFKQVSEMEQGNVSAEYWEALNNAYLTAQDVYGDMNATQTDIDRQVKALQAAVDAIDTQVADLDGLNALLAKAQKEADRTDVVYTSATMEALKNAIANAQAVAGKENPTKAEVEAAKTAVQTALDGLRQVDRTNLNDLITKAKAEAAKTDVYDENSLKVLNSALTIAENVAGNALATEADVQAAENALTAAMNGLVKKAVVDKSSLESAIATAKSYLSQTDVYTESSLAALQSAINSAQNVMDNESASQTLVDEQVSKLTEAVKALVKKSDTALDITKLSDGVYSIYGTMVKVDKTSASMSNEAINHTIKLTVKNGKYYITLNFNGLTVGQKLGYLSKLKYFTTGYTLDKYGNPQGTLADVTVDSYQKNADGSLVSDTYGSNYPDEVTFELIPEALEDGYVPLQVFVPIMDAISAGTGTQPVFLKLDWSSLKATTADDPDFDKNDNNNGNVNGTISNGSSLGNGQLGNNTLGNSSLGSSLNSGSSLKSGASSLGSGSGLKSASSVKTADMDLNQMRVLWAAVIVAAAAMAFGLAGMFRRRRNGEEQ